jgi:TolB-like protein/tetratricopeptide (TPR) repeat protein
MRFFFSDQCLDTDRRELYRGSQRIDVQPQVFDVLVYLVQNSDRVITRDDLISAIWNGRIVSESTLTSRINAARKAIGDNGLDQKLIRTIPRKGFLFVGALQSRPQAEPSERNDDTPSQKRADEPHSAPLALDRPAVAVLPFKNIGEPEQEYFSEGISDDIITALSRIRWFYVIARNSSFNYRGQSVPLKEVGEQLGVGYVVEGSVRRDGERVRISVQLSNVSTGIHIWSERYDRSLADVFSVQDEITQAIVGAIEPQLYAAENFRAQRKTPDSMDAWDLVVRALSYYWRVTRRDNMVAQALLEKTISIDPHYGQAHGLLAASHMFDVHMGWTDIKVALPAAEQAALAAIRADSEDSWAHYALASVYLFTRRFEESFAEFELALRLNPSFSPARAYYCGALSFCGEWEKGYMAVRHALRLSPRDPFAGVYFGFAGFAQFIGGNYEAAIQLAREGIRLRGDYAGAHRVLTAAAAMAGYDQIARDALRDLRRSQPSISLAWITKQMPFKRDAERSRYLEALRRAGLR